MNLIGSNPSMSKSTKAVLKMNGSREFMNKDKWDEWDIRMHSQEGNVVTLQVLKFIENFRLFKNK